MKHVRIFIVRPFLAQTTQVIVVCSQYLPIAGGAAGCRCKVLRENAVCDLDLAGVAAGCRCNARSCCQSAVGALELCWLCKTLLSKCCLCLTEFGARCCCQSAVCAFEFGCRRRCKVPLVSLQGAAVRVLFVLFVLFVLWNLVAGAAAGHGCTVPLQAPTDFVCYLGSLLA